MPAPARKASAAKVPATRPQANLMLSRVAHSL